MRFSILAVLWLAIVGLGVPTLSAKESVDEIEVKDPELLPGDKAPAFAVEKFLKGDEFSEFESGKVYIVECWATWCGPCLKSIPHLTELQEKHPDVKVVGIAVSDPKLEVVENFVTEQGDNMGYVVAWEGPSSRDKRGEFSAKWMDPAAAMGIPQAFIVDGTGQIAWMGHPMAMDKALEAILEGTWDVKKFRKEHLVSVRIDLEKSALDNRLGQLAQSEDTDAMLDLLDKYLTEKPKDFKQMCTIGKVRVLGMKPKYAKQLTSFLTQLYANAADEEPETVFQVSYAVLESSDAAELIQATSKWPKELKASIRKACENKKVLAAHPAANLVAAKAQLITGDREKAAETLKEFAETLTDPKQGKAKLQILQMAVDFAGESDSK
jgi:thiol-disulfide isomerase/thioredoxin